MTRYFAAFIGAVGLAVAVPPVVLMNRQPPLSSMTAFSVPPITPSPAGTLDAALARQIFGNPPPETVDGDPASSDSDTDTPQVVGIVGRLPDHAIALVSRASGGARSVGLGDTVNGWTLKALSADVALFTREGRSQRVNVTAGADGPNQ